MYVTTLRKDENIYVIYVIPVANLHIIKLTFLS